MNFRYDTCFGGGYGYGSCTFYKFLLQRGASLTYTDKEGLTDIHYNYFKALRKKGVVTFIFAVSSWLVCGVLGILMALAHFPSEFFYLFFAESFACLVTFLIWYVSESVRNRAPEKK